MMTVGDGFLIGVGIGLLILILILSEYVIQITARILKRKSEDDKK